MTTLLFVACVKGHRLLKVNMVRGVGPVVRVDTRRSKHVIKLADLLAADTVSVDPKTSYTADDAVRTRCGCGPATISGVWLKERLAEGRRSAVWPG